MSAVAEILAIDIGLRGIEKVEAGLKRIADKFGIAEEAVHGLAEGLGILGVTAGLAIGGIREAMEKQDIMARLEGLTNSFELSEHLMKKIDEISAKGIWGKKEVSDAVIELKKFNVSVDDNIDLVEKLGARMHSIGSAATLIGSIESGLTHGLARRLREAGIGPDALRGAGLNVEGMEVKGTPQEIIKALEKIEKSDTTLSHLQSTLGSTIGGFIFEMKELVETIGEPLLGPLTAVVGVMKTVAGWAKAANEYTHGWISNFIGIATILVAVGKMAEVMKEIAIFTRLSAIWTGILDGIMAGWSAVVLVIKAIGSALAFMTDTEKLAAAWMAILDALEGNWAGLAAGAAVAAAVGVAWVATGGFGSGEGGEGKKVTDSGPASRPIRRDDIERLYKRMYGNAWTG